MNKNSRAQQAKERLNRARAMDDDAAGRKQAFVEQYAQKSTPLIGVEDRENPNHFDVINHMVHEASTGGFHSSIRQLVSSFRSLDCQRLVHLGAGRFFSRTRLDFIVTLLRFRHSELCRICGV